MRSDAVRCGNRRSIVQPREMMEFGAAILLAALARTGPCDLVRRADVIATLHWDVGAVHELPYRLPQTSGMVCRYETAQGTVMITLPDRGSSFFNNNDLVDPFKNDMGTRVRGIGASVTVFDNTAYVSKHGRSVSVAILPTNGEADAKSLITLAKIISRRMR